MAKIEIEKGLDMDQELIQKYDTILPAELINIWKDYGMGQLLEGYLRVINPEDYQQLFDETYFRGNVAIPIFTTAFGDIITLEDGEYIGMVKYKNGTFGLITRNFKRFMLNIEDDYFVGKYFQLPQYKEAVEKLGRLAQDECFGYVPLLGLGGRESVDNLSKVKIREHIELISLMMGGIGM